jgi:hypothetical protein
MMSSPPIYSNGEGQQTAEQTFHRLLFAGISFCFGVMGALIWVRRHRLPENERPDAGAIMATKQEYAYQETIVFQYLNQEPGPYDWIGIFIPDDTSNKSALWQYSCGGLSPCWDQLYGGEVQFGGQNTDFYSDYNLSWPLCSGNWIACILIGETNETLSCTKTPFKVLGNGECVGFDDTL